MISNYAKSIKKMMIVKKMVSGQMFWGPVMLPVFFTYNELLAGRGFAVCVKLDEICIEKSFNLL